MEYFINWVPDWGKVYLSKPLKQELQTFAVDLQTALSSNIHDSRPRWWVSLIVKVRRLIETVIGLLFGSKNKFRTSLRRFSRSIPFNEA